MMGVCFLCDEKLYGERTQVCSSITPHSNILYPQKIAQLMGDEVVVIVTPADHMCKNCTLLLTKMDKLENDLKLVKNAMLSYIHKKYGIVPPDQIVEGVVVEEQLEKDDLKVPSGLTVGVSPTVTTAAVVTTVQTSLKLLKTQQQQKQQQQQQQRQPQHQQQSPTQQKNTHKMKTYKCGFCTFQSKELGHVRFHIRTHMNKKEPEKPFLNQAAAKALTPVPQQKKLIYRCQVCSKSFDSRIDCLHHIHNDHTQLTPSTSNGEKETEDSRPSIADVMKLSKTQENNVESLMDVDRNQQDNNKGTVDTDMRLYENVHTKGSVNVKQEKGTENTGEEEDKAVPEQEEADQETPDSVEK